MLAMRAAFEKAKAAPISRSDLENSFHAWQISYELYIRRKCKCQVNAAGAAMARCRT